MSHINQPYSPTHGRTTDSQHHADLQVLKRIRQFLLPSEFQISANLLQQLQTGYDIADNPVDNLLTEQIKFANPYLHPKITNRLEQFRAKHQDEMNWWLKQHDSHY